MYKLNILRNGLTVITSPMYGTKTATILIMVGTGSKYEKESERGISHFLEHMLFKGTKSRPTALKLSSELDGLGAEYNAFTSKEYTGYFVKAAADKLPAALAIVSDMFLHSLLRPDEIEREKGVIIEEMNMYWDNPLMYLEDVFEQCLYGDTPAGRDTIGTKASVSGFKQRDFIRYREAQYGAANTHVVVAGNIDSLGKRLNAALIKNFLSAAFKKRGSGFSALAPVKEGQTKPAVRIHFKATDQAHLSLGVRTAGYADRDKIAIKLLSIILGGSMSSRLFISLRERRGLAYYVQTQSEHYSDHGYLTTRAGVPVDKLNEAMKIILSEYGRISSSPVPAAELKRAKDMIYGRMTIDLEESDHIANWYASQAVMAATLKRAGTNGVKIMSPENFFTAIKKVSAGDLKRVAKRIFKNNGLNLAVIGPYDKKHGRIFTDLLKMKN
jgi:predicted Zn-dependent peptidase